MGKRISRLWKDEDIVSKKSLNAVIGLISFLKTVPCRAGLTLSPNNEAAVKKILKWLKKGKTDRLLRNIGTETFDDICAAFLQFLQTLPLPLLSNRVQNLIVADNPEASECMIAHDVLDLLKRTTSPNHRILLMALFDLLDYLLKHSNISELEGYNFPLETLPESFHCENTRTDWKKLALILQELVTNGKYLSDIPNQEILPTRITTNNYTNRENGEGLTAFNNIQHGRLHRLFRCNVTITS